MASEEQIRTNCDVPQLWQEHKTMLQAYIFKKVKDPDLTQEILQEVLLKVYAFCIKTSGVNNLKSWLFQIAHNSIIDNYRKHQKFPDVAVPEEVHQDDNSAFKDAAEYIEPLLNFLPPEYATPLRLADIHGLKQAEVAQKLGLSLSATKSRIRRGRSLLKEEFISCCLFETDRLGNIISFQIKDSCTPLKSFKK